LEFSTLLPSAGMATYNFDETNTITGYFRYGTEMPVYTTVHDGVTGTITSANNRKPYVSGVNFLLIKKKRTHALANGTVGPMTYSDFNPYVSGEPIPATVYYAKDVNKVLADTNPSRAIVDLPVSIAELRDIPHLLKGAKKIFRGAGTPSEIGATAFLSWEFGIKPMLKDLKGVLDFQGQVDRRVQELSRMYKRGGSRHRSDNGSGTVHTYRPIVGYFAGSFVQSDEWSVSKAWTVVNWKPDSDLQDSIPPLEEIHRRAFRAVFGLNVSVSTVWEALPWSWLIDWFSSVGDYFQANRNSVGFIPGTCYQMVHTQSGSIQWIEGEYPLDGQGKLHVGPSILSVDQKERFLVAPGALSVSVPLLSARQLGILGSLAILRL
jgi:hypothetical protein